MFCFDVGVMFGDFSAYHVVNCRLDEILTALPQTSLLEVWHKLMDEMKGYVVLARDDEGR